MSDTAQGLGGNNTSPNRAERRDGMSNAVIVMAANNDVADQESSSSTARGDAPDFRSELSGLINRHSKEGRSNTPDFILRDFLCCCLNAFDSATAQREKWHGRDPQPEHTRYGVEANQ